ncbi:Ca-activated chloride channel family protein [Parabacteroides sp. PF5-5]|uniref:vWA domain-containing protein n=1 Tax=unclassified Parabacteroides TaxID=2649774 RepID=UPI002473BA95|nr:MULTISPECIES: VWA domain-containing protein [unclassified Parabacteroides]MDH6305649.1 Ca-activated chloride channel family protein [Parabacteroides sp. PH5-39]MDH6316313.1 Ca-activated chloride channel family protein [Parabacteroides sp. PF5-13]MDH6319796.1 Ca-activated chloride channel family protein [Parabacteroides sp. PH5-13]MDH6323613.1 Ca-activated chloride channel family protein [Parabacteroides sp. PH5-8]MDH6327500.1 Ca-activated chloride channel family protein [Parabacteroides sp.
MKTRKNVVFLLASVLAVVLFACSQTKSVKTNTQTEEPVVIEDEYLISEDRAEPSIQYQKEFALEMEAPVSEVLFCITEDQAYYANTEEYGKIVENRFKRATDEPLSTFSIDVDAASYSNMRRFINQGQMPPADAIRTEELVNYFSYNYAKPKGNDPVKISAEVGACPWNEQHRLVHIGIKAKEIAGDELPASNLVFLIDVSGSMYGPTRLELVKSSLKLLVNNLREQDRVAIVVYSGSAGEVLPSTSGSDKQKIREALDNLTTGGSTAGGAGIQLAYKIAEKNFIPKGNNRIILCTDGDFNVGVSSNQGLEQLIETKRKSGVFLTVLGYGMGNYKDSKMQVLAEKGNGNHAYIDNLQEANRVLVSEFGGTIYTVAKDVKLQIEFNPAFVQAYRLIGYESRLLNKEDFNDDTKDAGEMGAGHVVTAFYEVIPVGVKSNVSGSVDDLKYQQPSKPVQPFLTGSKELLTVKLRYKQPDGDVSKKMELPLIDNKKNDVSSDFRFASSVAMFGQLLRNSDYKGEASYDKVIALAKTALADDSQGYRHEFVRLAETTKSLSH